MHKYVHGYTPREAKRLREQSTIVEDLLHHDTRYPAKSKVLEAGCGVGAQTLILAKRSPGAEITSIDISEQSLSQAEQLIKSANITNVQFQPGNIAALSFEDETFDHVFVCFVLEHLDNPGDSLLQLKRVLKKGGSITVIEGDHGSFFWHPESEASRAVWGSLIKAQQHLGHDPLIGRKLYPLLEQAGFTVRHVSPRTIYGDGNNMELMTESVTKILIPMIESSKQQALDLKLIDEGTWLQGIKDFYAASSSVKSTFFYSWFKAVGIK